MNQRKLDQTAPRFWGPVGAAGAASAAALTLLLGAVVSGATAATPSNQFPADPTPGSSVTHKGQHAPVYRGCFMGRHDWQDVTAAFPQCRVG
jgi:hypothetical protein